MTTYSSSNSNTKSRRAYIAESEGRFPATKIATIIGGGVQARDVKEVLGTKGEWHHTGTYANETSYYDAIPFLLVLGKDCSGYDTDHLDDCDLEDAREEIDQIKALAAARNKQASGVRKWKGCVVKWTEWSGSRRRPQRTDFEWSNCTIEQVEGKKFATISHRHTWTDQDGKKRWRLDSMRKDLSGNWIDVKFGKEIK